MMHAAAKLAGAHGVACKVCMEQAMACGMGTCQSCVVKIEDRQSPQGQTAAGRPWRYRLACTDGPVFDAQAVVW
jgi:dihydroorotate dehydrogenase electron transfer subunit